MRDGMITALELKNSIEDKLPAGFEYDNIKVEDDDDNNVFVIKTRVRMLNHGYVVSYDLFKYSIDSPCQAICNTIVDAFKDYGFSERYL